MEWIAYSKCMFFSSNVCQGALKESQSFVEWDERGSFAPQKDLMKHLLLNVFQLFMGGAAIFFSFKRGPITYRYSTVPFPNQRLARTAFFVVGVALILGGLWSLWPAGHVGR